MNKKQRENRANQLNPNNSAYWKSRMGNSRGSSYSSGYSSNYSSSGSSSSYFAEPKYVDKPPRGLFGKVKGDYGWVICDHVGRFVSKEHITETTGFFCEAAVFRSEKEAKRLADRMMSDSSYWRNGMPFLRVRCVEL